MLYTICASTQPTLRTSARESCVWIRVNKQLHLEQISDFLRVEHEDALKQDHSRAVTLRLKPEVVRPQTRTDTLPSFLQYLVWGEQEIQHWLGANATQLEGGANRGDECLPRIQR
ncbi:hypothetical protein EYF80_008293 [Liparis tanakae]|uniref:Uncharacterized protein n=1 Tax=Liparis tanakae TaxID=230148 RepID=A0A4Z2IUN0_9TELE|nr:hypothetical protein EYF80_008293 [Liparis tanakae]